MNENPSGLDSKKLYDAFMDCACKSTCTASCGSSLCNGQMPSLACQDCIVDTDAGCGNPFFACTNDVP
jgi:hypothetical protein